MRYIKLQVTIVLAASMLGVSWLPIARASRWDKANTLTQCISKSETILIGFVDAKDSNATNGVVTVRVLRVLKGKVEAKELRIFDPSFRADFGGSPEGPVVVEAKKGYIFFLQAASENDRQLFDPFDGVVLPSGPVVEEIVDQVARK